MFIVSFIRPERAPQLHHRAEIGAPVLRF